MTTTTTTAVKALVLRAAGTNCDDEAVVAFERAGAVCERRHVNRLYADPRALRDFHVLVLPGGFSYGDDIHSGKVLAIELRRTLGEELERFLAEGKLILGICNGFQVLVKAGLLPLGARGLRLPAPELPATLTWNTSGQFECRWSTLRVPALAAAKSPFLRGLDRLHIPVAHAEGRLIAPDNVRAELAREGQVACQYVDPASGEPTQAFPHNPNGSQDAIAGLLDPSGQILGLMPHPERAVLRTQLPAHERDVAEPPALTLFRNAVAHARDRLAAV